MRFRFICSLFDLTSDKSCLCAIETAGSRSWNRVRRDSWSAERDYRCLWRGDWSPTLVSGSGALRVGQGPVRTGRFEKFGNAKAVRSRHSVYRVWLVCGGNSSKGVYLALERTRPVVRKRDWLLPDPQSVRLSSGFSLLKSIKNVIVRLAVVCPKASEC